MVFNSLTFLAFLAILLVAYHLPIGWTAKKALLLAASYLFYAAWNPPFVALLVLAAVVDFVLAGALGRAEDPMLRRAILAFSLTLNLGLLGFFKYGNFLLDNFVAAMAGLGIAYRPARPTILLPLGISFYTFETISYLVDVYRRKIRPWGSFLDYALFLTFFPHLVAGPIVRAPDFLPQCRSPRRATGDQLGWGLSLLVLGLFEKMILADGLLRPVVDLVFERPFDARFADAWVGAVAFAGQLFFDFAGYSTCAIGVALCFGFVLKDNFRAPFAAVSFSDFWRRWHISLSTWVHDYVFVPLGGAQHGAVRTSANLLVAMLLIGFWHGASWRFVAWGGLMGLLLVGERVVGARRARAPEGMTGTALMLRTFLILCFVTVLFRAADFGSGFHLQATMLGLRGGTPSKPLLTWMDIACTLGVMACTIAGHGALRNSSLEDAAGRLPAWARGAVLSAAMTTIVLFGGSADNHAYIYFQF